MAKETSFVVKVQERVVWVWFCLGFDLFSMLSKSVVYSKKARASGLGLVLFRLHHSVTSSYILGHIIIIPCHIIIHARRDWFCFVCILVREHILCKRTHSMVFWF